MKKSALILLTLSGTILTGNTFSQNDDIRQLDRKLESMFIPVTVSPNHSTAIKLPKRKYDSPMFCNEIIPWKGGYFINSLSIAPGGSTMDHSYRFFYFCTKNNKLEVITSTLADSIESIIVWNNTLYLSGKKNGESVIGKVDGGGIQVISKTIKNGDGEIGTDSWVKLGVYNDQLLALQKNGVFIYEDGKWRSIFDLPFPARYYKSKKSKYYPLIPTENIRISNNILYFLQEVTQQRTADLYSLDLSKDSCAIEFFTRNGLTDNTKKEVISYTASPNGLWVAVLRLMQDALLLKQKGESVQTLVMNNHATTQQGEKYTISPSCISQLAGDTMLLAGSDGLFMLVNNHIKPLAYFMNTSQQVKVEDANYQFDFVPRCVVRTNANRFLVGGLWGGLYLVDTGNQSMQCLDDLKKMPPNRDLLSVCQ